MSPGYAVSRTARSRPKTLWAYFVANGRPLCAWTTTMPRSKTPEHTRANASRSRWLVSMPAWTLNTNALNGAVTSRTSAGRPSASSLPWWNGAAGGASSTRVSRIVATPKLRIAEAKSTGVVKPERKAPGRGRRRRPPAARTPRRWSSTTSPSRCSAASAAQPLLRRAGRAARGAGVGDVAAGAPVEHAAEVAGDADRPGQRGRHQPDLVLDLLHQRQRVEARPVPLVDDGDDRDAAGLADPEQLERLRLQALGGVDEHHRGVDGESTR